MMDSTLAGFPLQAPRDEEVSKVWFAQLILLRAAAAGVR